MNIRFQVKQLIKQAVQSIVLPVCYGLFRFRKADPDLVVFADAHHDSRPAAMELLYQRLKKDGSFKICEHYQDYGSCGAAAVARHSIHFMKLYARAGFVVICDNFLPAASCRKRKETKVIQLWHACGCYKKFGYDASDDIPRHYHGANVYRNADLVTVSGDACVKPFASAMRLAESCVQPLGVSRTDLYHSKKWTERCRKQFFEKYPEAAGKKIVLWAPTFRGNAGNPENISVDLTRLQESLGGDYQVLARPHPHMLRGMRESGVNANMSALEEFICPIPTEELYPVTDVLVADYSSLVYEYMLFGKPVVLYCPDLASYRSGRGFYMDITEIPGEIVTEADEKLLAEAVRHAYVQEPEHAQFLDCYMGACDGQATKRIVQWIQDHRRGDTH